MTDKKKITDQDMKKVAGGRSDQNTPTARPNASFEDANASSGKGQKLTPEQAASVSAGRNQPTAQPTASVDAGPSAASSSSSQKLSIEEAASVSAGRATPTASTPTFSADDETATPEMRNTPRTPDR